MSSIADVAMKGFRLPAQEEFVRGDQVCTESLAPGARGPAAWARLLDPAAFFAQFKNYLTVRGTLSGGVHLSTTRRCTKCACGVRVIFLCWL